MELEFAPAEYNRYGIIRDLLLLLELVSIPLFDPGEKELKLRVIGVVLGLLSVSESDELLCDVLLLLDELKYFFVNVYILYG